MKSQRILLDQPRYLGDIIFVMAIAQKYASEGYVVDFPLEDEYYNIPIQKYFPNSNINYIRLNEFFDYAKYNGINMITDEKYIYLPLAESWARGMYKHMKNKYDSIGLSVNMWRNVIINRDYETENRLFSLLGLNVGDKYNLINENHQKTFIRVPIHVENEYKNIYMSKIDGYSIFDWIGIMVNAQSIHTVGTSLVFLMDIIISMPSDMHIYRRTDKDHSTYNYLLTKKYIYHN